MFDSLDAISNVVDLIRTGAEFSQLAFNEAQKNDRITKILQSLNLAPIETADSVEIVYAYALVE